MRKTKDRVKSFFIEPLKEKSPTKEELNSMYVVKLEEDFQEQFPLTTRSYVQADTLNPGNFTLTDKIYKNSVYGHKVLFTLPEATAITDKLSNVPLEVILVSDGTEIEEE